MSFIIKVQLPIATNVKGGMNQCLAYNEAKTIKFEGECPRNLRDKMGKAKKKFFYAEITEAGILDILDEAPIQTW